MESFQYRIELILGENSILNLGFILLLGTEIS